jgi:hypothetical protein
MFHLAVVLEKRHVVGGGLDARHDAAFVVHLDRGFAEAVRIPVNVISQSG